VNKAFCDVSVIVANYNHAALLPDLFRSVIESTIWPKELILINDGSTDHSLEVIRSFLRYPFVRLIDFEVNRGFADALNTGIDAATGRYIARIDPDDFMMPDRLERQFQYLEQHSTLDVLGGNVLYFHGDTGKPLLRSNFPSTHDEVLSAYKSGDHGVQHPTVMAKREVMKQYRYVQHEFPVEDYDLFARIIRDGYRFANLPEPMNKMRIHAGSVSNSVCFGTVQQTFALRDQIFGGITPYNRVRRYYRYILNYRRFLYSRCCILKLWCIVLASVNHPQKVILKLRAMIQRFMK